MFGISATELVVIAVLLLLAVGPDKMPTFLKTVVRGVKSFQKTTRELRNAVQLDRFLEDGPAPAARLGPPPLALSEYERQREQPKVGVDVEHARSLAGEHDAASKAEYPGEGADVAHANAWPMAVEGAPAA